MSDRRIFKYEIPVKDDFTLEMPLWHAVLCVQVQQGTPCIWAEVDTGSPLEKFKFSIYGTGHLLPKNIGNYVGTFQMGDYVWHLYSKGKCNGCSNCSC